MGKRKIKSESQFFVKDGKGTIIPLSQEKDVKIRSKQVNKWGFEEEWETTFKPTPLSSLRGKEK